MPRVFVPGVAVAQGNLRRSQHGGMYERNPAVKEWRNLVASKAAEVLDGLEPTRAPVGINARFIFLRPASHLRKDHTPKASAPKMPTRPDLDKLVRAALDGLTGVAFVDDGQVVKLNAGKEYGNVAGLELVWHILA